MADESKEPQVKFRHMEEEKWHEVRAIELPTGRVVVREKWLEFSDKCLSLVARWDPGMIFNAVSGVVPWTPSQTLTPLK